MSAVKALSISEWQNAYRTEKFAVRQVLSELLASIDNDDSAWIYKISAAELESQVAELEQLGSVADLPLYGIPFAVKDNIDVANMPTSAACAAFTYIAQQDAFCVARLKKAGAIVFGKTNLDQFATGLVGTRSPYGVVPNSFNPAYVAGGSSSGSAVCVARGFVPFSLGTDTAGSGRVPAGFNNIVGLKPTRGRFSARGVVPACRSLDCVSVFAMTVTDAEIVADILQGFDDSDAYSRIAPPEARYFSAQPRFGIPATTDWFGDENAQQAWKASLAVMADLGVELVAIDFSPMYQLAALLYGGAWVAERYAAISNFIETQADTMHPVVRGIIEKAKNFSAVDTFSAEYQRMDLVRKIQNLMRGVDALLVPTAPCHPTIAAVQQSPVAVNSQLGTYTNFVNLADSCALALPACFRSDGLPFGVTLIAPAWQDLALAKFGKEWQEKIQKNLGATDKKFTPVEEDTVNPPPGYLRLAVVGAHLRGMPLNFQLQDAKALFVEATFTADFYRLFALPNSQPPKPGLLRCDSEARREKGAPIAVELWDIPISSFGKFVSLIPPPLGIGSLVLKDKRVVKGFICEPWALEGADDITHFGGWKAYIQSLKKS